MKTKSRSSLHNFHRINSLNKNATRSKCADVSVNENVRINEVGVQMINEKLRKYLFTSERTDPGPGCIERSLKHLSSFDLNTKKLDSFIKDVDHIELPKLKGKSLDEHFQNIGNEQTHKYRKLISLFAANESLPKMPTKFCFKAGWTK